MRPGLAVAVNGKGCGIEKSKGLGIDLMTAGTSLGFGQTLSPLVCLPTHQLMFPVFLGERVPPKTLASTLAELDRCLQLLEDKFLKDQDFLAGSHISVADLVAITELMHVSVMEEGGPLGNEVSWREPVYQLTLPFLAVGLWANHLPL